MNPLHSTNVEGRYSMAIKSISKMSKKVFFISSIIKMPNAQGLVLIAIPGDD
jgi:hypothetical protein